MNMISVSKKQYIKTPKLNIGRLLNEKSYLILCCFCHTTLVWNNYFYQWNEQLAMAVGSMSNNPADNMYCMVSFFQRWQITR